MVVLYMCVRVNPHLSPYPLVYVELVTEAKMVTLNCWDLLELQSFNVLQRITRVALLEVLPVDDPHGTLLFGHHRGCAGHQVQQRQLPEASAGRDGLHQLARLVLAPIWMGNRDSMVN